MTETHPGPWTFKMRFQDFDGDPASGTSASAFTEFLVVDADGSIVYQFHDSNTLDEEAINREEAKARLIAASWELLAAAELLESAEHGRQDCDECEDEGEPEACGKCFPKFDDARVMRRNAIAKAKGKS